MRLSQLALPLFVTVLIIAGIATLNFAPSPQTAVAAKAPDIKPVANDVAVKPVETAPARNVGGGAVPAPVLPDVPLERIAPLPIKKPLEMFGPPMPPLSKEETFLLFQPVVENAGTLIAEGRMITLSGVLPVEATRMCVNADGGQWPCGKKARTEFRALVRGRAISCLLPDQQIANVETECRIGKENLAEWLVEKGWAEAKPGSEFESLGQAAKLMGRGIYGRGS
jgi:endonuclease YncB( thermonuclease family)